MAVTVIDSTDMNAILADAGVEVEQPADASTEGENPEVKKVAADVDPDDVEGEDGFTPREKREFTERTRHAIGKKHRQLKEAEEFAAAQYNIARMAEQRAQDLERENAELRAKIAPPKEAPKAPERPKRENFANEGEYVDAMIQYGVDQRLREKAEEDAKAAAESDRQARIDKVVERLNRAREIVPDWEEVAAAADVTVPPVVASYMEKSEMIAELSYHFAKNPDILLSLGKLAPDEQLVKIGRIESTLTPFEPKAAPSDATSSKAEPSGQAKKPAPSADPAGDITLSKPRGNAAPVITPLDGTGSAGNQRDSKDMNIRESIEDFSKRNRVNLNMRKRH